MVRQPWGGPWTEEKLERVRQYLGLYTTALKNQSFSLLYIDAFAGSGIRSLEHSTDNTLFEFEGMDQFVRGSARMALEVQPNFDRYVFIEKGRSNFRTLQANLRADYPDMADKMEFRNQDANLAVKEICVTTNWRSTRAVAFLDPYGMQVEWSTLEAIAATQRIDMWYLFPSHMGVARTVTHDPNIPPKFRAALNRIYGTSDWEDFFYKTSAQQDLFSAEGPRKQRVLSTDSIEVYTRKRLETIFKGGVAKKALRLNREGRNMYLLFFAVGNPAPKARKLALKFAKHVLEA